jgi:hypothetical protein
VNLLLDARDLARQARLAHVLQLRGGMQLGAQLGDTPIKEAPQGIQPGVELGPKRIAQGRLGEAGRGQGIHAPAVARLW